MMHYIERADNVYMIDTKMFDFENYQSAYLVEGKELALIDTGLPNQYETVREGIAKHGFSIMDIDHIFITHCEHPDHSGNAGNIVRDNTKARLHIHPAGAICLTDPSIEEKKRKAKLKPEMAARFGTMIPVPQERIETVNDGDIFDVHLAGVLSSVIDFPWCAAAAVMLTTFIFTVLYAKEPDNAPCPHLWSGFFT